MTCPRQAALLIMCPGSNAPCSCHATPAAMVTVLCNFVCWRCWFLRGRGGGRGSCASQQPLLCRIHAVKTTIIQERETEGDSSTAKYSVIPVWLVPSLSPPPLRPRPLPSLHTGTLAFPNVLGRFWWLHFSTESTRCAAHSKVPLFPWNHPHKGKGNLSGRTSGSPKVCAPAHLAINATPH